MLVNSARLEYVQVRNALSLGIRTVGELLRVIGEDTKRYSKVQRYKFKILTKGGYKDVKF